jgi:hypothetical protein
VATRFYFTTGAATYTPTSVRGTWNDSTLAATQTFDLARTKAGTNTLTSLAETSTTNNYKGLLHRHVSGPLVGGTLTGGAGTGYTHAEARQQSATAAGMVVCVHIWFTVGNTSVVRSTFANMFVGQTPFATAMTNFYYTTPDTATATFQAGDRMVIEMGYSAVNTANTSFTGSMRIGGTAADAGTTTTTTGVTTNSPWIEFPAAADAALAAYTPPAADNSLLLPVTYGRYRSQLVR